MYFCFDNLNRREKGSVGENIAKYYLSNSGYRIIEQNYWTGAGEIDLIAVEKNSIVFIEVKLRKSIDYGYPSEAVDIKKQNRIKKAALIYISKLKIKGMDVRFDVVEIFYDDKKYKIIKNAF